MKLFFASLYFTVLASTSVTAETLIFEDNFDKLDFSKWQHELTLGGGGNWYVPILTMR